jgi:hypothetical protein
MANCSWLRNDGGLILQNDGTSNWLMNDNSCAGGGETLATGVLAATGTGTTDLVGNSFSSDPAPFAMTGTASVLFRSLTDVLFSMTGTASAAFRGDSDVPAPIPTIGAGGAKAWHDRYREDGLEKVRRAYLLALIRQSDDYKRLKRKLAMLHEHLLDARGRVETVTVREKIAEIEAQIEMMERLE